MLTSDFNNLSRNALEAAFRNLSANTCVDFYPRTNESNFIEFVNEDQFCR